MLGFFGMPGHLELLILATILLLLIGVPLLIAAIVIVLVLRSSRGSADNSAANLIPCPDCGRGLSPLAESCPGCGRPVEGKAKAEG